MMDASSTSALGFEWSRVSIVAFFRNGYAPGAASSLCHLAKRPTGILRMPGMGAPPLDGFYFCPHPILEAYRVDCGWTRTCLEALSGIIETSRPLR
jgi:hypothetical protein